MPSRQCGGWASHLSLWTRPSYKGMPAWTLQLQSRQSRQGGAVSDYGTCTFHKDAQSLSSGRRRWLN